MGRAQIDKVYDGLPGKGSWGLPVVQALREAAGNKLKAGEAQRFREILEDAWKRFTTPARRAMEALAGVAAPDHPPIVFTSDPDRIWSTGVPEQSAVAFLGPKAGLVTVSDDSAVLHRLAWPQRDGVDAAALTPAKGPLKGLEGCAHDADAKRLLVVSEDSKLVWSIPTEISGAAVTLGAPEILGELPALGEYGNKGWEGLAVLPAALSADKKKHLLAVHEAHPRGVGIFHPKTLAMEAFLEIPAHLGPDPLDLSDLAVDPKTGRLVLLSDESNAIYQFELRRGPVFIAAGPPAEEWSLVAVGGGMKLPVAKSKPEGLCFDHHGDLWVVCEAGSKLIHLARG
jgi:hypothetical protein